MSPRPVEEIAELLGSDGAREYLGEPVTVADHLLQTGALAEAAGAPPALVAAALLHDVGHLLAVLPGDVSGGDDRHGESGSAWLSRWFPPAVTEPVRLHVAAKRYLCGVAPSYFARLSKASVDSLAAQGGPMSAAEARGFEALPYAADAVAVRRWDDQAKDPQARAPDLSHFLPLLNRLAAPASRPRLA
jgi:gamma-butyrobetaine dioxygenase